MNPEFYRQTHRVEARHWWFRHRRALFDAILARAPRHPFRSGLDLGCGTGGNLALLGRHCRAVVGVDRSHLALELARASNPDARLVRGDANRLAELFRPGSFDLVAVFNVLYHRRVADDRAVLTQVRQVLAPGGWLVLTEPAFPVLARRHDVVDHAARRYRRAEIVGRVANAGFRVRRHSCFNLPAFPPALLLALLERLRSARSLPDDTGTAELAMPPGPINDALVAVLGLERAWLAHGLSLALGVGVLVVAERDDETQ